MRHGTALSSIACRIVFLCRVFSAAFSAVADEEAEPRAAPTAKPE